MLTKADDYPIHQLPLPVSEVGSERNFYDRYFFNGYNQEGDIFFAVALCLYPNLNIMDGSFANQVLAQIHLFDKKFADLPKEKKPANITVELLPKKLDEEVAAGMVGGFGGVLTVMTDAQAEYINTPKDGPFKPETYKY